MKDSYTCDFHRVVEARIERLVVKGRLNKFMLNTKAHLIDSIDELTILLSKKFLRKTYAEDLIKIETPSSWFQHWKRDCAPAWLVKRWPVHYNIQTIARTTHYNCPHHNIEGMASHYRWLERHSG